MYGKKEHRAFLIVELLCILYLTTQESAGRAKVVSCIDIDISEQETCPMRLISDLLTNHS